MTSHHSQPQQGRSQLGQPQHGQRTSPLHDAHIAAGASFTDFAGWLMPVRYAGDLAEHRAVRTAAGIFDLSHMAEILLIGPEAGAALDYALAGALSALAIGQAKYSLLLSPSGGVVDDVVVYRTGADRYLVVANAANREVVADELRVRAEPFEAEVIDQSDDVALIAVQGPASLSVLLATPGFRLSTLGSGDIAQQVAGLKRYWSIPAEFEGQPTLIARTGYTGEDGFELCTAVGAARPLWDALLEAGADQGLAPAGLASRDTLRLEAGMPLYGHELGLGTMPAQAGLGRVVNLGKETDFVGRAAAEEGPGPEAPVLVGMTGEGKRAARAGYAVLASAADGAGAEIGVVTSGALSPTLGVPIAMAYIAPHFARPGTSVRVDVRGSILPFTVTELPFYSRAAPRRASAQSASSQSASRRKDG